MLVQAGALAGLCTGALPLFSFGSTVCFILAESTVKGSKNTHTKSTSHGGFAVLDRFNRLKKHVQNDDECLDVALLTLLGRSDSVVPSAPL